MSVSAGTTTQRIVLTGASGTLGRAILRHLAGRMDISVLALYRESQSAPAAENISAATCDLSSCEGIALLLEKFGPTAVIHAAATGMQIPRPDAKTLTEINVLMPMRLAEIAAHLPDCSFVHVSSGLAYQDQGRLLHEEDALETKHPYGASKAEVERRLLGLARQSDLALTIVRPFSFTGPGDFGTRLFPSLLACATEQRRFEMSAGDQVRDHSSVDDIAMGMAAAAILPRTTRAPRVFNLGKGDTRTLRELVTSVIDQLDLKVDIQFGARPHASDEPMFMVPDTTRARKIWGWAARENLAHAVWRLARQSFPALKLQEPKQFS